MKKILSLFVMGLVITAMGMFVGFAGAESPNNIFKAILVEKNQKTPNISFDELQQILIEKSATVIDSRTPLEYAIDHIPGVVNVSPVAGAARSSMYDAKLDDINGIVKGEKSASIVVYCSGPYCGKSKVLANALLKDGYTNVERFQLGIPVWRALGGITEVELDGIKYVSGKDQNAIFIDARDPEKFKAGTVLSARNIHLVGVKEGKTDRAVTRAKKDGRLPKEYHNVRIIVFGKDGAQARAVVEQLVLRSLHNVSYFSGTFDTLRADLEKSGKSFAGSR